ncbi:TlpA family protein disulfide reductase [Blastococcus goldschmidtiae]|uniref:Redoxin family protein n=1 Tax=Blastococcus goldschmidtiae TaxID=3075546 RepID=A0ABU2KDI7_9ACTN|nr:redoxin family protein [Blastococcus sp. DSM 46792]MDT0278232.1 redoxin family protein [Blastococcus sp. DSM 46792]
MPNGTPTILTFVDLCPTCIADTRTIAGLQERFADVAVLAVASDPTADRARVEDFVGQAGARDFQLALDPQSTLTTRFDAFSMSASVLVVDRNGEIVYRGPVDEQAMADALTAAGA